MKNQPTTTQKLETIKACTKKSIILDSIFDLINKLKQEGVAIETSEKLDVAVIELEFEQRWADNESKKLSLEIIRE